MRRWLGIVAASALLAACNSHPPVVAPQITDQVPLFAGLGDRSRAADTGSAEAQTYFDQGLSFLYAFNHDEAIRSFRHAAAIDPDCAMAWWGIAVANGPHINNPVVPEERARSAWEALQRAQAAAGDAGDADRALITALAARYSDPPAADRAPLDVAYADAMRAVWQEFPADADVGALFAEAMMDLRPWDLWTSDGTPQPGTEEIVATLERVLALDPRHPLGLHLYIHAVEASPDPGRALAAADTLRDLQPGLGHLVHMPSHIDVRLGRWQEAIDSNVKAMAADRAYRALAPKQGFYGLYMAHDNHMLAFAAMMNGQRQVAVEAMDALVAEMPAEWAREYFMIADGYMVMPLEVRLRFGLWDEVLAAPDFDPVFPFARAMRHYARGVAFAAKGDTAAARDAQRAFDAARASVPPSGFFGNNTQADLLAVAEDVLEGEILYREGDEEAAFAALRQATVHEDALRYDEPPGWILPSRHALGALLLDARRPAEAEAVFRRDLVRLPENGWGLYGLARSLELQGETAAAAEVRERLRTVWARSDIEIATPCYCAPAV
jgi:tetratricopeptide (TPR) repeat protein